MPGPALNSTELILLMLVPLQIVQGYILSLQRNDKSKGLMILK